ALGRSMGPHDETRAGDPALSATRIDDFLARVAAMRGRELTAPRTGSQVIADLVRQVRSKSPLRERLKAHLPTRHAGRDRLDAALRAGDAAGVRSALHTL